MLSPGMLYGGLDIATAEMGKSRCRNEAIAEAFHYMHIARAEVATLYYLRISITIRLISAGDLRGVSSHHTIVMCQKPASLKVKSYLY